MPTGPVVLDTRSTFGQEMVFWDSSKNLTYPVHDPCAHDGVNYDADFNNLRGAIYLRFATMLHEWRPKPD